MARCKYCGSILDEMWGQVHVTDVTCVRFCTNQQCRAYIEAVDSTKEQGADQNE